MKSLYFVGNEELWNDAWFLALVESLKSSSLSVSLLDLSKDVSEIRKAAEALTVYERIIFHKGMDPDQVLNSVGARVSEDKKSLLYVFSEIVNSNAVPKQVPWGAQSDEILKTIGLWDASQILEEAFLFDLNVADEVSKAIGNGEDSLIDQSMLTANAEEISHLLDPNDLVKETEIAPETKKEANPFEATRIEEKQTILVQAPVEEEVQHIHLQKPEEIKSNDIEHELELKIDEEALKGTDEPLPFELREEDLAPVAEVAPVVAEVPEEKPVESSAIPVATPFAASVEVSKLISAMSPAIAGEDLDVIKRYAGIKERELRESLATSEALRRQIRYFDERIKKSEEERRRLLLKLEETENVLRTVSDKKDENKIHLKNIEHRYEEKIKELQIQLESSQFQAGKLDKKLIDFRERVRNDLQKIRTRERELASRLEIQKRDAEALLSAKDERLLNQKREVDRLEFELDALRERLYDDAQKNEERRKRVSRALQSLKLAQSILAGLEEDSSQKDDKDKAA